MSLMIKGEEGNFQKVGKVREIEYSDLDNGDDSYPEILDKSEITLELDFEPNPLLHSILLKIYYGIKIPGVKSAKDIIRGVDNNE